MVLGHWQIRRHTVSRIADIPCAVEYETAFGGDSPQWGYLQHRRSGEPASLSLVAGTASVGLIGGLPVDGVLSCLGPEYPVRQERRKSPVRHHQEFVGMPGIVFHLCLEKSLLLGGEVHLDLDPVVKQVGCPERQVCY